MLLKYGLGEESAAKRIETAVIETLNKGFRTGDIFSSGMVFSHVSNLCVAQLGQILHLWNVPISYDM